MRRVSDRLMAKRKSTVRLKVNVIFISAPDYRERLHRVISLLMRHVAEEVDSEEKKPLSDSVGVTSTREGNMEDRP